MTTKPSPEAIIGNWKQEIVGEADASLGKYNAAEIIKALTDAGKVIVDRADIQFWIERGCLYEKLAAMIQQDTTP